jgi:hypothetical protein
MLLGAMDARGIPETMASQSPKTATALPPPEALSAFVQVIDGACYPSPRLPAWWLATAIKTFDGLCAYCGRETGSEPDIDAVIPVEAGGPQRPDAAVLTCKTCKQARRRRDLLLWEARASTKLQTMRAELALDAWNHLSRDPATMQTPEKATDVIRARWQHPRFHCHGALLPTGGFIGWRQASLVPSAMQMRLVFDHGGWRLRQSLKHTYRRNNTSAIFWVPTRDGALGALWDVIEHNGLVRHATLGIIPPPSDEDRPDPARDWARVFPTIAELVRRHRRYDASPSRCR